MENNLQNEKNSELKCAICGDVPDLTAERDTNGAPIWGVRDEGGIWGGAGLCGDWHRWVVKDD